MNDVGVGDGHSQQIVQVGWKAAEAGLVAHETMDEDEQQPPAAIV